LPYGITRIEHSNPFLSAITLIEAGTDEKVKQLLANYLIVGPLSFEATNARFKRDTEVMLTVLKEVGLKPE